MSYKAREDVIVHHLKFGLPKLGKVSNLCTDAELEEPYDEKAAHSTNFTSKISKVNYNGVKITKKLKRISTISLMLSLVVLSLLSFARIATPELSLSTSPAFNPLQLARQLTINQNSTEKFEVYYPYVVEPSYGEAVYSTKLLDHVFGNSYGQPDVVLYTPPDVEFNRVVLTLNTSVGGVQFDRLAHLYLNNIEIWRTSTIEPGGRNSYSSFKKDVGDFALLFQQQTDLTFLLGNIVDGKYTGSFHIELFADYYYDETVDSGEDTPNSVAEIFKSNSLPSKIVSLGGSSSKLLFSLPSDSFDLELPTLSLNTTRAKLYIFTSGNGDEEFWYTNVLDQYVDEYASYNMSLLGHGPIRHVEARIDGQLISSVAVNPVIFTGGISPAFWSPVVSNDAFDLRPYEVELTHLLPYLTNSTRKLEIDIYNALNTQVGNNWITSASLHIWEHSAVTGVEGVVTILNVPETSIVSQASPNLFQVVEAKQLVLAFSELAYHLDDELSFTGVITQSILADTRNVQSYYNHGYVQLLSHEGKTKETLQVDDYTGLTAFTKTFDYPLVLNMTIDNVDNDVIFDVTIADADVHSKSGSSYLYLSAQQNATSSFVISPNGNHGFGTTETRFTYQHDDEHYSRKVVASNNTIIVDEVNQPFRK